MLFCINTEQRNELDRPNANKKLEQIRAITCPNNLSVINRKRFYW